MFFVVISLVDLPFCIAAEQPKSDKASQPSAGRPQQPPAKPAPGPQQDTQQPAAQTPAESKIIVAKISDYTITKDELEARLMQELQPDREEYPTQKATPNAQSVLLDMLAEKATIIDGRKQGYLNDPEIRPYLERYIKIRLANLLLAVYLQDKVQVTGDEINQRLASEPNLGPARAKEIIQRAKAKAALDQFYSNLLKKFQVKKVSENFPKAVEIHQRLLSTPKEPRSGGWISNQQIRTDLTDEERNLVLAAFEGGKVSLQDWLEELCELAPPSRPRDLNTPEGVDRFLDRALRLAVIIAEAKARGLDKNPQLLGQLKLIEDDRILSKVRMDKFKEAKDPNEQQIKEYFEKNKESFGPSPTLKIDQIWSPDLKTAQQVRAELDKGGDFQALKQKSSLYKEAGPTFISPGVESIFWNELWKADPNQLVGPIKGFCPDGIKWRIVKVLEKKPGSPVQYSDQLTNVVKSRMLSEKGQLLIAEHGKELLKKYPNEIYADKIKDIDPFNIP
jgi:hypothetical protein